MHILGDLSIDQFLKDYWQKKPVLIRNAFEGFEALITAQELAGLSLEEEIESRIIVEEQSDSSEKWTLKKGPFKESDFTALPAQKWTLLVQAVDHWLPEAADLLEHFRFIPSWRIDDLMISYATDGGSVGPHFDQYDVFLLQAEGQRQWQLGQRCEPNTALLPHRDLQLLEDFDVQESWVLNPGDMLYVPPRLAHWGVARGECQTYSIGFRAPATVDLLDRMFDHIIEKTPEHLSAFSRYEDPSLSTPLSTSAIEPGAIAAAKELLIKQLQDDSTIASMLGQLMTETKYPQYAPAIDDEAQGDSSAAWIQTVEALQSAESQSSLVRHEHARFSYYEDSDRQGRTSQLLFFYQGEQTVLDTADLALASMLGDQRHYSAEELINAAASDAGKALLTLLWNSELIYSPAEDL